MFAFKVDIFDQLKAAGYNTTRIRRENVIGQSALGTMRRGIVPSIKTLDTLCRILNVQPGELIEWKE